MGAAPEFGGKFQNEIELLSLTKLRKNILPSRNLLNQKIDAYVDGTVLSWLVSYLQSRQFFVKLDDTVSENVELFSGVPKDQYWARFYLT